ncbi:hypothetical protein [Varibaculum cambriense]|nr:hypothetical protein [Varibaculum cambriense]MDU1224886.1 hypothetical protein [Varibaculum cambriense]
MPTVLILARTKFPEKVKPAMLLPSGVDPAITEELLEEPWIQAVEPDG